MVANGMSLDIMSEIFQLRENTHYHPRHTLQFLAHPIHSVYNGSESPSYLEPKNWEIIPPEIKAIKSLKGFNEKLRNGNLTIALVEFARFLLAMSVSFKTNLY